MRIQETKRFGLITWRVIHNGTVLKEYMSKEGAEQYVRRVQYFLERQAVNKT